ncbi:MAG: Na+/H+ antiporter subunit E [Immundisolibacteraceae bacterium]|nr:Na+/H+ antiporter subunit E [Immundisolibacteraceae bacterium]
MNRLVHGTSLALTLAVIWYLLSGHTEALLLGLGCGSAATITWLALRMDLIDHEGHPLHLTFRAPLFWVWLMWEIIKANGQVIKIILDPKLPINPRRFRVPASQKTDIGKVIYANSITLTPGTICLDVTESDLDIHALTADGELGLKSGEMDRLVTRLEGDS